MTGRWKKQKSRVVYRNPWIVIHEDAVIRPDGKRGIYGFMELGSSAGTVALTENNEIYLIREYRYPLQRYTYEIPRGAGPKKESRLSVAKRELKEEAGITAKRWTYLGYVNTSPGVIKEFAHIYLARDLQVGTATPEGNEKQTVLRVPFADALSWAQTGKINDALTISALLRVQAYCKL